MAGFGEGDMMQNFKMWCRVGAVVCGFWVSAVVAQHIERPRPAGWEHLRPGVRFVDRFGVAPNIGEPTSACWGGDNVRPRDVRNGIEEKEWSYWGGNITKVGDTYHLFVARWREDSAQGHMTWFYSEIAHATSSRPDGDFKVVDVVGGGHNPELFRCKDGSWALYCINAGGQAHVYRSTSLSGPWTFERLKLDLNGKRLIEGESNFSFCVRPDGSVLAVCRGGGMWISEDGKAPFVQQTDRRVYPPVEGRFEDPVLWRDEVQYHLIVNDWYGRVAWYLTSPDGIHDWQVHPGEAYVPGIGKTGWYKYERMKVLQDRYGRVVQSNFAVIDCQKRDDRGSDNHSSKNITFPMNPGRRITSFQKTAKGWEACVMSEEDFDARKDLDVKSVVIGPQSLVAFGGGVPVVGTHDAGRDLVLEFPPVELNATVVELFGRETSGKTFFASARTDGRRLDFYTYPDAAGPRD